MARASRWPSRLPTDTFLYCCRCANSSVELSDTTLAPCCFLCLTPPAASAPRLACEGSAPASARVMDELGCALSPAPPPVPLMEVEGVSLGAADPAAAAPPMLALRESGLPPAGALPPSPPLAAALAALCASCSSLRSALVISFWLFWPALSAGGPRAGGLSPATDALSPPAPAPLPPVARADVEGVGCCLCCTLCGKLCGSCEMPDMPESSLLCESTRGNPTCAASARSGLAIGLGREGGGRDASAGAWGATWRCTSAVLAAAVSEAGFL
mmetsp:Transcript_23012/g.58846  ORF Transcript_23012/g.58846 Transcript_23012/m.58846 type:complete len:271 (-) Transcript_23012:221-1033(-)